jgi:hypothetical protein
MVPKVPVERDGAVVVVEASATVLGLYLHCPKDFRCLQVHNSPNLFGLHFLFLGVVGKLVLVELSSLSVQVYNYCPPLLIPLTFAIYPIRFGTPRPFLWFFFSHCIQYYDEVTTGVLDREAYPSEAATVGFLWPNPNRRRVDMGNLLLRSICVNQEAFCGGGGGSAIPFF